MKQKQTQLSDESFESTSSGYSVQQIKPILKTSKPKSKKQKNRVQFNESLNKFFDADYVILIREDDEYREHAGCDCEEDYCFDDCYEDYDDYGAAQHQQKKEYELRSAFDPPVDSSDLVTLSPPDGYKDCSPYYRYDDVSSYDHPHQHQFHHHQHQHRDFSANAEFDYPSGEPIRQENEKDQNYIVKTQTITITTVTDKRIVQDIEQAAVSPKREGILKNSGNQNSRRNSGEGSLVSFEEVPQCNHYDNSNSLNFNNFLNTNHKKTAVGQLFPGQTRLPYLQFDRSPDSENNEDKTFKLEGKYVVPEESLRLHDLARKSKLFNIIRNKSYDGSNVSDEEDIPRNELIRKTIQRSTLRRSFQRHSRDRKKKKEKSTETLVERIKKLTCDIDEPEQTEGPPEVKVEPKEDNFQTNKLEDKTVRQSPSREDYPQETTVEPDKTLPSTGVTSTYKKLTDLFSRRSGDKSWNSNYNHQQSPAPDIGNGQDEHPKLMVRQSVTSEARRQFLSSLAPLTACVTGHLDESPMTMRDLNLSLPHARNSFVDNSPEGFEKENSYDKKVGAPQPDVVAGTPARDLNINDELANFAKQDARRTEKIKKRYNASGSTNSAAESDDDNDDYGFNQRPAVKGIKPMFGSTNEILQQIQSQLEPPIFACSSRVRSHMTWPYYIETDSRTSSPGPITILSADGYPVTDNSAAKAHICQQQKHVMYTTNNVQHVMRLGDPTHVSMMVPYQPEFGLPEEYLNYGLYNMCPHKNGPDNVVQMRVTTQPEMRIPHHMHPEPHYSTQPIPPGTTSVIRVGTGQKQTIKVPCPSGGPVQVHLLATRNNESPQNGPIPINSLCLQQNQQQMVVARGTQTASMTSYYNPQNIRAPCMPPLLNGNFSHNYATLALSRSSPMSSVSSSPTRKVINPKTSERGVPEGAASNTPPIKEGQVPLTTESNSVFYTMNV